jgi:hypothetical protein
MAGFQFEIDRLYRDRGSKTTVRAVDWIQWPGRFFHPPAVQIRIDRELEQEWTARLEADPQAGPSLVPVSVTKFLGRL